MTAKKNSKHVYFVQRADGIGPIKIGCSSEPEERISTFSLWSPYPLKMLAYVPGGFREENCLHWQFDEHRLHGEWFFPVPELLELVKYASKNGRLPGSQERDRTQEIRMLYDAGETLKDIGDKFGVSRQRIEQIAREIGLKPRGNVGRKRAPVWSAIDDVRALAEQGCTHKDISEKIGDSYSNVVSACKANGIKVKKARRFSEKTLARAQDAAKAYREGEKIASIAKRLGVVVPDVYRLLRVAGVKPNRSKMGETQ